MEPLRGNLDRVAADRIEGWAQNPARPDQPVELELLDNDVLVTRFHARAFRADLERAGIGGGHCAFLLAVPDGWSALTRHVLRVRRASDGTELRGSPIALEKPIGFAPALRDSLAASLRCLAESGSGAERQAALRGLVTHADALLRARAAIDGTPPRADAAGFYARWGDWLADARPPVARLPPERPAPSRRRAVVVTEALIDAVVPPLRTHLLGLRRIGHEVTIVAAAPDAHAGPRTGLEKDGFLCVGPPFFASVEEVLRRQAGLFDVALLYRAAQALCYGALVRRHLPRARLLLCMGDLESARLAQRAAAEERPELFAHVERARARETIAAWLVDAVLTESEQAAK